MIKRNASGRHTKHTGGFIESVINREGAQWLSGRVLDSRPRFEPHWRHCVVSLSKNNNPSLHVVLVQPRKILPYIAERLLMGRKENLNQIKQK